MVLNIVFGVVLLAGLIGTIMSIKGWHWAQMLLLLGTYFAAIGFLILAIGVYSAQKPLRSKLPQIEKQTAEAQTKLDALTYGADAAMATKIFPEPGFDPEAEGRMPGFSVWTRRLQDVERRRGAVWRGVTATGAIDAQTNRVPVAVPHEEGKAHGLAKDTIVYAFEQGEPTAANPNEGSQYLGEFKVVDVKPDGAVLESVYRLDDRTGNRIARSKKPWELYETMPIDRHELFSGMNEEKLRGLLPAGSVDEYIRDGQPAKDDDPQKVGLDEHDQPLGPDDAAKAVKWVHSRLLHDYAYLFSAAHRQLVQLVAQKTALTEDNKKLLAANEDAKKLGALRTEEQKALTGDLGHMKADRKAIETLLATVLQQLTNAKAELTEKLAENARYAEQLRQEQLKALSDLDRKVPVSTP